MLQKCNKLLYKNKNKNMYNKKIAKKLNRSNTIDLKGIIAKEYLDSKKTDMDKFKEYIIKIVAVVCVILYVLISLGTWSNFITINKVNASEGQNLSIKDKIRLERLEVCQEAYKNSGINKQFIHKQIPAVRCATYMGLIYAYESNFWKSRKCVEDRNCHGMKWNGVDTPRGFLKFKTYKEGRQYFAKKYFKWHYKKNIETFVYNWSMTDRNTYINFVRSKYWKMYKETEYLYLTWKSIKK